MPIMARCRECGKQYRIKDELAGEVLPCKECGANFRVPARRPAPVAAVALDDDEDDAPSGGGAMKWIIGGAAAGVVILGVALTLVIVAVKKDEDGGSDKPDGDQVAANDDRKSDREPPGGGPGKAGNKLPENNGGDRAPANRGNDVPPAGNGQANNDVPKRLPGGLQPPPPNNDPPERRRPPNNRIPGGIIPAGNDGGGRNFGAANTIRWNVKVDPPAVPFEFKVKGKLKQSAPNLFFAGALYPSTNSAFVALGCNTGEKDYRNVYDLQTTRQIGQIGGLKLGFTSGVLSQDGNYFAVKTRQIKGILIWDVRGRKALGTLPLNDEKSASASSLEVLDFAGTKCFVAAGRKTPLWVWSVPDFNPLRTITLPESFEKPSITFSPGGRYMTLYSRTFRDRTVYVFDLSTGTEAGRIELPGDIGLSGCKGMAFSPDGEELAGAWEFVGKARLFVWNVADGRLLVQHSFQTKGRHYKGPGVQWFPDKSKWLVFGNDVIDRKAGGPIWSVPKVPGARDEARLLDGDRILLFGKEGRKAGIGTMDVPHEELAKAANVIGAGGSVADVNLPPLKKADWSAAVAIPIDGVAGGWKLSADPAPRPKAPLMTGSMTIDSDFGQIKALRLARRDAAIALVHSEAAAGSQPRFGGLQDNRPKNVPRARLDRYDVTAKRPIDSLTLTYPCELLAVSPDGTRAVLREKQGKIRVDVWSVEGNRHVAGFKPFVGEKSTSHRKVTAAEFVDNDHVLTLSSGKKLALWKLPECKAVYVIDRASEPQVTPGGRYVALPHDASIRFFEARTGEAAGDIQIAGKLESAAIHPDGDRLAAVVVAPEGWKVATWDLKTGKSRLSFYIPKNASVTSTTHWCGDDYLLIDGLKLVDLKHKMIVWSYLAGNLHAPGSPDGQHWYLSLTRPTTLTAAVLPGEEVKARLAGRKLEPKTVLRPGMKVGLNIQLNGLTNHPNLRDELYRDWTQKLQQRGLEVDPKAPVVLFARADAKATGKSKTYTITKTRFGAPPPRFGGFGGRRGAAPGAGARTETVADSVIDCRIVFGIGGKAYGERKTSVNKLPRFLFGNSLLKPGETADAHFTTTQQNQAAGFFRGYSPPGYLFEHKAALGLGISQLVAGGGRIAKSLE